MHSGAVCCLCTRVSPLNHASRAAHLPLAACRVCATTPPPSHSVPTRWGSEEFGRYVQQLAGQADAALAEAPQHTQDAAALVARVAALEVGFWGMAYDAAADGAA